MPKKQSPDTEIVKAKISARTNIIVAVISGLVTLFVTLISVIWGPQILQNLTRTPTPTLEQMPQPRDWYVIFEHKFPASHWTEGIHKYLFQAICPFGINSTKADEPPYSFSVRQTAEIQNSMIYIRRGGLYLVEIFGTPVNIAIHPSQETTAIYAPLAVSFEDAKRLRDECMVKIQIDDGVFLDLQPTKIDKLH
jgi:hypothetical protein